MQAGQLRERVTIEDEVRQANGQGGFVTSWAPIAQKVPAKIIALTGDEALRLGVERSVSTWRVTIRKRPDVTPRNRLKWGALVLAVRSVLPDPTEPQTALVLVCESGNGS